MRHECKQMQEEIERSWERLSRIGIIPNHGPAIRHIEHVPDFGVIKNHEVIFENVWVAHCDEYATVIKYCPFCGTELNDWNYI